jgi:hypothetical protein
MSRIVAGTTLGVKSCEFLLDSFRDRELCGSSGARESSSSNLHAKATIPGWLGERLDVGWAIDVLHPLARGVARSS